MADQIVFKPDTSEAYSDEVRAGEQLFAAFKALRDERDQLKSNLATMKNDYAKAAAGDISTTKAFDEERHKNEKLKKKLAEMQATFDLRWKADMRAIKRWQKEHPGNDLVWPDHADMVVWLMEKLSERPKTQ